MRVTQEPGALREINSLRRHWNNELILTCRPGLSSVM